jgi:hypothetical protein
VTRGVTSLSIGWNCRTGLRTCTPAGTRSTSPITRSLKRLSPTVGGTEGRVVGRSVTSPFTYRVPIHSLRRHTDGTD